ncbi:LysE family translocator [Runella sp.]|uniref:LysE family translocator n=1 Tax=Runella sp. TaxID=1960881 RepID=UPI003D0AD03E
MLSITDLLFFAAAAFGLVISPGPNMIYLISRSITQGKRAGLISLAGVICGFLFHILLVSFGLTTLLFAVPFAYTALQTVGVVYLLYLAWQALYSTTPFETKNLPQDNAAKLFRMGFFTNVLNPKVAVFYVSFFPQFVKPELGNVLSQNLLLGLVQVSVSFSVNFIIVLSAQRMAFFFGQHPRWIRLQKWFMASILTSLAAKLAFDKVK